MSEIWRLNGVGKHDAAGDLRLIWQALFDALKFYECHGYSGTIQIRAALKALERLSVVPRSALVPAVTSTTVRSHVNNHSKHPNPLG